MTGRPLRVLHCPDVVGGHAPQLARAERVLGLAARCVAFQPSPYGYEADEVLARPEDRFLALECRRFHLLWRALRRFDVVHFNFGSSIFPGPSLHLLRNGNVRRLRSRLLRAYQSALFLRDLPLLKMAGKAVFVTYQGDDARQGDYCRAHFPIHFVREVDADYYPPGSDELKRRSIRKFARYADGVYALNPDLLHVLPAGATFLPYASVNPDEWRPAACGAQDAQRPLRLVHAPSHRAVKGTGYLVRAVARLKAEGVGVALVLAENMTREAARRLYETADLAVDQLFAGWYGGFAVEAMALAKPVVSYLREEDLKFLPVAMRDELPVVSATPESIYAVLKELLTARRRELPQLGANGRKFVERWHHPAAVARRTLADYERAVRKSA